MGFDSLNKLWESTREASHDFRVSTEIFPSFDVDRIAKTLNLTELAKRNGEKNLPESDDDGLDEVESKIIETIENEKKAAYQLLEDQFHVLSDRLNNLDFEGQFGRIRQAVSSSVGDFKAEVASGKDELHPLRNQLHEARQEKADFRKRYNIKRAARVHGGAWKFFKIAVLILVFVLETMGNGFFLAKGSEQGLIGGITAAAGFSAVNVGFAVILALFCVKLVNHRSFFLKLIGSLSILAYLLLAGTMNLALAHYREAAITNLAQASTEVITRLKTAPFGLAEFDSWLLFALGILLSLVAFIDGLYMSDPYPGYGGVESRTRSAYKRYIDRKNELIESLKDIRDDHNEKVEDIIRDLSKRRQEHSAIIGSRVRMVGLFTTHQNQLEAAANTLLKLYRSANTTVRTTPQPAHFKRAYELPRINPQATLPGEWNDVELGSSIKAAQAELADQIKQIGAELEAGVASYHQLDSLFPDVGDG